MTLIPKPSATVHKITIDYAFQFVNVEIQSSIASAHEWAADGKDAKDRLWAISEIVSNSKRYLLPYVKIDGDVRFTFPDEEAHPNTVAAKALEAIALYIAPWNDGGAFIFRMLAKELVSIQTKEGWS